MRRHRTRRWPPGLKSRLHIRKLTAGLSDRLRSMVGPRTEASAPQPASALHRCRRNRRPSSPDGGGERLSIDEFTKIELRVAKVLTAERVPKSKKLMKLWIDLGYEQRTLVAGIAEAYEPDAARRPHDRDRRQPEAREADGHRIERHDPRGLRRRWPPAAPVR